MDKLRNKDLLPFARQLRKDMTPQERKLWYTFLRGYTPKFTRQKVMGKYIADFYCAKLKLVLELDGSQHFENAAMEKDEERTAYLRQFGVEVLRFANNEINNNFSAVCQCIDNFVREHLET